MHRIGAKTMHAASPATQFKDAILLLAKGKEGTTSTDRETARQTVKNYTCQTPDWAAHVDDSTLNCLKKVATQLVDSRDWRLSKRDEKQELGRRILMDIVAHSSDEALTTDAATLLIATCKSASPMQKFDTLFNVLNHGVSKNNGDIIRAVLTTLKPAEVKDFREKCTFQIQNEHRNTFNCALVEHAGDKLTGPVKTWIARLKRVESDSIVQQQLLDESIATDALKAVRTMNAAAIDIVAGMAACVQAGTPQTVSQVVGQILDHIQQALPAGARPKMEEVRTIVLSTPIDDPMKIFAHSHSLFGTMASGRDLEGSHAFTIGIHRAQFLLQHAANTGSPQREQFSDLARTLVQMAAIDLTMRTLDLIRTPDIKSETISEVTQQQFSNAVTASAQMGSPQLISMSTDQHQTYFSVSASPDGGKASITYYNLGLGSIEIPTDSDPDRVHLAVFTLDIPSPEWSHFLNAVADLRVGETTDMGSPYQRFYNFVEISQKNGTVSRSSETFKLQKTGNCTFKALSAFIKDQVGAQYTEFRNAENTHFFRQLSEFDQLRVLRPEVQPRVKNAVLATLNLTTRIFGTSDSESEELGHQLQRLLHPDFEARLITAGTDYFTNRWYRANSVEQERIAQELGCDPSDFNATDIQERLRTIVTGGNTEEIAKLLDIMPTAPQVFFTDVKEMLATLDKFAPRTSQSYKILVRNIRSGNPDEVLRQLHKMDPESRIRLVSSGEYRLLREMNAHGQANQAKYIYEMLRTDAATTGIPLPPRTIR